MALTRDQMATEVLDNLSRLSTGTTRSGETLANMSYRWLNRAQVAVARKYDMLFKEATASTVASQQSYSFPSNLRSVFSFRCEDGTNSVKLIPKMSWQFDAIVPKPDAYANEGRPTFYIPYKTTGTFELYQIPDAVYVVRLRYSVWPAAFAASTDTADWHDANIDVDDVIIQLATSYGMKSIGELIDAASWKKNAFDDLKDAWMAECSAFPDWVPVDNGFSTHPEAPVGEYWNDPFVHSDQGSTDFWRAG